MAPPGSRFRAALLCAGALAAAALLAHGLNLASASRALDRLTQQDLDSARRGYEAMEMEEVHTLQAALEGLQRDGALMGAFRARDRERLLALARPRFERLRACCRVTHFYFIESPPSSRCFLRVHDPDRRGDRIDRATYRQALRSGSWGWGKELGATAFALRVVAPWRAGEGGTVIGYLELGEEIDHFLDQLKGREGGDYALYLYKARLDKQAWAAMRLAAGQRDNWEDAPRYVLARSSAPGGPAFDYSGDLDLLPRAGLVQDLERRDGRLLLRGIFPVRDAAGTQAGMVQVWRDVSPLAEELEAGRGRSMGLSLGVLVPLGLLLGAWLGGRRGGREAKETRG